MTRITVIRKVLSDPTNHIRKVRKPLLLAIAASLLPVLTIGTQQLASAISITSDTSLNVVCVSSTTPTTALSATVSNTNTKLILATGHGDVRDTGNYNGNLDLLSPSSSVLDTSFMSQFMEDAGTHDDEEQKFSMSGASTSSGTYQMRVWSQFSGNDVCLNNVSGNDLRIVY